MYPWIGKYRKRGSRWAAAGLSALVSSRNWVRVFFGKPTHHELAACQESHHRNQRYEKNDRTGLGHGGGRRKFYEAHRGWIG